MNRRLLPYEYQLIEALGVSKEEYLEFVALQQEYKDPKAGTALDVRNELATVAIVLTVVGTLFQVGAALLAPKPKMPDIGSDNQRRTRQQRFSPSSGFNSAPELASYGDPVNLVYTNKDDNPAGGVRISGSLVWSSVDNYGSSQFMQLLFVLGAAEILNLSTKRTAFGSLSIDQLDPATTFLFYKSAAGGKNPVFDDLERGDLSFYPQDLSRGGRQAVCQVVTTAAPGGTAGFSQAYSPTTSSSLGVYDPIPVNVEMVTRDSEGEEQDALNGIELEQLDWTSTSFQYKEGREIIVRFQSKGYTGGGDDEAVPLAVNLRRQSVNALDFGSTYMLGSAKFRLISFGDSKDIDNGDVNARFRCVESGFCPTAPYDEVSPIREARDEKKKLEKHLKIIKNEPEEEEAVPDPPTVFDKDFEELSVSEKETEKESNRRQYIRTRFENTYQLGNCKVDYNFNNKRTAKWKNVLDQKNSETIDPGGSVEYTKELERQFMEDPPTMNAAKVLAELNSDRRKAQQVIDEVNAGDHDKSDVWLSVITIDGQNRGLRSGIIVAINKDKDNNRPGHLGKMLSDLDELKNDLKNIKARVNENLRKSKKLKASSFDNTGGDATVTRVPSWADLTNKDGGISLKNSARRIEKKLSKVRDEIQSRREELKVKARRPVIRQLRNTTGEFVSLAPIDDGVGKVNRYGFGGLRQMEEQIDNFPRGKRIVDEDAVNAIGRVFDKIRADKAQARRRISHFLENWEDCIASADNHFFVKALVKAESAAYETMSEVDQVKFSIKSKLFRRISGRQKKYGETPASKKYSRGDNGIHGRQAFFRFSYKKGSDKSYTVHPVLFSLRQASESDAYNDFNFLAPSRDRYAFKLEPVYDVNSEINLNGQGTYVILNSNEKIRSTPNGADSGKVWFKGSETGDLSRFLEERGPKLINEWDVFSVNTDTQIQFSLENGPEMSLTAVTEQQTQSTVGVYKDLSMFGLSMFAGRNVQDLRNVTAFVEEGKKSYRVNDFDNPSSKSTSYAPDIFVDTVLDKKNGIGKYAPPAVLDQDSLKLAKKFCQNNKLPAHPQGGETPASVGLFMDCVIADNSSWREFWVSNSPFSLLEFARKNGKETLVPVVPVTRSGRAAETDGRPIALTISALFTTGNILEDSYKEEFLDYGASTQDLIASVVYREEYGETVFQRKRTVQVERADSARGKAIRETFDASGFVTSRQQAILFGKMLVNQRKFIRRGIEFKTFPTSNPIEPGAFIYVDIGLNSWDRSSSGVIADGGALNSPLQDKIPDGTYSFLIYDQSDKKVSTRNAVSVSGGVASSLSNNVKDLYVMGVKSGQKRVFRITEVEMDQDGEVTVRAIEYPCDDEQRARVADFRPELFDVS